MPVEPYANAVGTQRVVDILDGSHLILSMAHVTSGNDGRIEPLVGFILLDSGDDDPDGFLGIVAVDNQRTVVLNGVSVELGADDVNDDVLNAFELDDLTQLQILPSGVEVELNHVLTGGHFAPQTFQVLDIIDQ